MIVLVSGSTKTMRGIGNVPNLGVFFNPNSSNYRKQIVPVGMPWAADNAAYIGFDRDRFESMIDTLYIRRIPNCLFLAVPDVVGKARETLRSFLRWQPLLKRFGWPLAFVAQDGLTLSMMPWEDFDVLFVGGSTRWKLGIEAHTLCAYASACGKRIHIGRVNSPMRAELFSEFDPSFDGTATSRFGNVYIPKMLKAATDGNKFGPRTPQRELF